MIEIINLVITWFLVGLIWIVQVVHYPSFLYFEKSDFLKFHHFHTKSITWIVIPTMTVELILGAYLLWQSSFEMSYLIPFIFLIGIWASTALLQIPLHLKLADRENKSDIRKLISTNWIRTVLWTLKGLWLISLHL